ncbi:hypothetical protein BaRGS_00010872 [Batillaria attramentaria]|uniref:Uncharacterized protein n=1 Tax=Batillaria attramentaria TaxID=370345 RepID=A0ABD0LFM0_9CAEN
MQSRHLLFNGSPFGETDNRQTVWRPVLSPSPRTRWLTPKEKAQRADVSEAKRAIDDTYRVGRGGGEESARGRRPRTQTRCGRRARYVFMEIRYISYLTS